MEIDGIKYVLIGNPKTKNEIGCYPEKGVSKKIRTEATQIFLKFCENGSTMKDLRNKINNNNDGNYFFTINSQDIFYLVLADKNINERDAFALMDYIQNEKIPLLIDISTQQLNLYGRQQLKTVIEKFFENNNNKLNDINIELEDTKKIMKNNIKEMTNNVEEIENMEGKAVQIKENADLFNKNANNLRKAAWWSNCKWTIILILVIILLLIIILPISISVGKKKKDDDKEKKNNTTRILYFND
jgi:hypothetical protein